MLCCGWQSIYAMLRFVQTHRLQVNGLSAGNVAKNHQAEFCVFQTRFFAGLWVKLLAAAFGLYVANYNFEIAALNDVPLLIAGI